MVLFKLFPEARTPVQGDPADPDALHWDESIFDKIYFIQLLLQSLNNKQYQRYQTRVSNSKGGSQEYEKIARGIIERGGVKSMSVAQISETSKLIKEKMDVELRAIITSFELTPDFFITSHSLRKLWAHCFQRDSYRAPIDLFIQAFDETICKEILSSSESAELAASRRETLLWLFNAQEDSQRELCVGLDSIVN